MACLTDVLNEVRDAAKLLSLRAHSDDAKSMVQHIMASIAAKITDLPQWTSSAAVQLAEDGVAKCVLCVLFVLRRGGLGGSGASGCAFAQACNPHASCAPYVQSELHTALILAPANRCSNM